jgi:DnaJ-domain-containing protein 1
VRVSAPERLTTCRDNFVLLNEPRRPWLDPNRLKDKFLVFSAQVHPDRVHQAGGAEKAAAQERYALLNGAYQCLRDPKERLKHLLELERGAKPPELQEIPQELMDLFLKVGSLSRQVDGFLGQSPQITSPLLHVRQLERSQEWLDQLRVLQSVVQSRYDQLLEEIKAVDAAWEAGEGGNTSARGTGLKRLEEIYRLLGYFGRWLGQLRERSHLLILNYA